MFKNKDARLRSGWKIVFMMLVSLLTIILISTVISVIVTVLLTMSGDFDAASLTYTSYGKQVMKVLEITLMFLQEIIMIATPIIAWKFIIKRPLSNMGLVSLKSHSKELSIGLLFGIISITIVFVALVFTGNAQVETWKPHFAVDQLIYFILYIFVGFAEEIYGRGYIMSALRQTKNVPVTVIVSAIIFALLHSMNPGISIIAYVNLILVGILFAFMYLWSGNLWMCIGYHITWNYFQGYVYGFKVSGTDTKGLITTSLKGNKLLNGGAFGPEGGLFVTLVVLIGFIIVWYYYKDRRFDFIASEPTTEQSGQQFDRNVENYTNYDQN